MSLLVQHTGGMPILVCGNGSLRRVRTAPQPVLHRLPSNALPQRRRQPLLPPWPPCPQRQKHQPEPQPMLPLLPKSPVLPLRRLSQQSSLTNLPRRPATSTASLRYSAVLLGLETSLVLERRGLQKKQRQRCPLRYYNALQREAFSAGLPLLQLVHRPLSQPVREDPLGPCRQVGRR